MNRRGMLKALAGLALCPACVSSGFAETPHWGYAGPGGPDRWSELAVANLSCGIGTNQSPIDIETAATGELPPLRFAWAAHAGSIVNNGHTIQIDTTPGSTLVAGSETYRLEQFHFHHPSEHRIGGKSFPMEVHFVHANGAGKLGVVGVLMAEGRHNAAFGAIMKAAPAAPGLAVRMTAVDLNALLPRSRGYYAYAGSLTTPPCSEDVSWMLLADPVEVAASDIAAFAKLYPFNARPVQKPNRRSVLRSR